MEKVLAEGKYFRLVDQSELPDILDFLGNFLPDCIKFHETLKTYLKYCVWDFHFYVAKSWPEHPVILHFPGMTKTPNEKLYESFSVFCPCDQLEHLELLVKEDLLIDWTQPVYLKFTHVKIMAKIEEFYAVRGTIEKHYFHVYGLTDPTGEENDTVAETVFTENEKILRLPPEYVTMIYDLYPSKDTECLELFEKLISRLPCYGVFSATGDLAAWMLHSYYGAMFSMQTKPQYRRKGYGQILAKYLTKKVQERGYLPYVLIVPENNASRGLFTKLGFQKHFETVRAVLLPHELASDLQSTRMT